MTDTDATVWPHHELGKELSNWGRWGADDQIGTLNFITPEKLVSAAKLIKTGKIIDCGIPFDKNGPFPPGGWRLNPQHVFTLLPSDTASSKDGQMAADDLIIMGLQASTQWDGLAHVGYQGFFYNGVPQGMVNNFMGAMKNDIAKVAAKLISRGVLLDIAALKGVEALPDSYEITEADVLAAEERQGVRVESGDIACVRTGWTKYFREGDRQKYVGPTPGPGLDLCRWIHDSEIAALALDQSNGEVWPSPVPVKKNSQTPSAAQSAASSSKSKISPSVRPMSRIATWWNGMMASGTRLGMTSPMPWSRASAAISLSWIHRQMSRPGPGDLLLM